MKTPTLAFPPAAEQKSTQMRNTEKKKKKKQVSTPSVDGAESVQKTKRSHPKNGQLHLFYALTSTVWDELHKLVEPKFSDANINDGKSAFGAGHREALMEVT